MPKNSAVFNKKVNHPAAVASVAALLCTITVVLFVLAIVRTWRKIRRQQELKPTQREISENDCFSNELVESTVFTSTKRMGDYMQLNAEECHLDDMSTLASSTTPQVSHSSTQVQLSLVEQSSPKLVADLERQRFVNPSDDCNDCNSENLVNAQRVNVSREPKRLAYANFGYNWNV